MSKEMKKDKALQVLADYIANNDINYVDGEFEREDSKESFMVTVSKESALKNLTETITKLTAERDKTISLMSQSWQHEPQGEELIYNHTKTLLEVIERDKEEITKQSERIKELEVCLGQSSSALCSLRKNYEEDNGIFNDVNFLIDASKQLLQKDGE